MAEPTIAQNVDTFELVPILEEVITGEIQIKAVIKSLEGKCGVCGKTLKSHSPAKIIKCLRSFVYIKDEELPLEDVPDAVRLAIRLELSLELGQNGSDFVVKLHDEIVDTQAPAVIICSLLLKHHLPELTAE
jgi:hypothetical protein